MFLLKKPSKTEIERFISSQGDLPFSYREVGRTRGEAPLGYVVDRYRVRLGDGEGLTPGRKKPCAPGGSSAWTG